MKSSDARRRVPCAPEWKQDGLLTDTCTGPRQSRGVLVHAPAPRAAAGLLAVPIHIRHLRASVVLDAATRRGSVDAIMSYQVGPMSGCPLFDLRQSIDQAWLDGRSV